MQKPYTVEEIIETLKRCDPKAIVLMSSDGEGNRFGQVHGIDPGEEVDVKWRREGFGWEPVLKEFGGKPKRSDKKAVVFYPAL